MKKGKKDWFWWCFGVVGFCLLVLIIGTNLVFTNLTSAMINSVVEEGVEDLKGACQINYSRVNVPMAKCNCQCEPVVCEKEFKILID